MKYEVRTRYLIFMTASRGPHQASSTIPILGKGRQSSTQKKAESMESVASGTSGNLDRYGVFQTKRLAPGSRHHMHNIPLISWPATVDVLRDNGTGALAAPFPLP